MRLHGIILPGEQSGATAARGDGQVSDLSPDYFTRIESLIASITELAFAKTSSRFVM